MAAKKKTAKKASKKAKKKATRKIPKAMMAEVQLDTGDLSALNGDISAVANEVSTIYHAVVASDGTLKTNVSTSGTTAERHNVGIYELDFPVDVTGCVWQATLVTVPNGGLVLGQPLPPTGEIGLARDHDGPIIGGSFDVSGIFVKTYDSAGTNADRGFHVSVTCSPLGGFNGPLIMVLP